MTRYADALAALVDPPPAPVHRDTAATRARLRELLTDHQRLIRRLRSSPDPDRARAAMRAATATYRARRAQLQAHTATPPSLLQQLLDAIPGTGGRNGVPAAGPYRSPIALPALDLAEHIRLQLGVPTLDDIEPTLRAWQPDDPDHAADLLDHWAGQIRALLDPPRSLEGTGPCPLCGHRWIWQTDGDELHRRAAIRIVIHPSGSPATDYAECLNPGCDGWWPRDRWDLLAAAMH